MPAQNKFYNQSWFSWLILLIIAAGLGWFFYGEYYKESVVWEDESAKSPIQVIQNPDGTKTVRNVGEGVEVTVGEEWEIGSISDESHKMKIVYEGPRQKDGTTLSDGTLFNIYCYDNIQNKNILSWAKERGDETIEQLEIQGTQFYKSTNRVVVSEDEMGRPIFLENSISISYLFNSGSEICDVSCTAAGDNYLSYIQNCERNILESLSIK